MADPISNVSTIKVRDGYPFRVYLDGRVFTVKKLSGGTVKYKVNADLTAFDDAEAITMTTSASPQYAAANEFISVWADAYSEIELTYVGVSYEQDVDALAQELGNIVYKKADESNFTETDYAAETDADTNGKLYIVFPD